MFSGPHVRTFLTQGSTSLLSWGPEFKLFTASAAERVAL